jgi:hypothetical protein
MYSLSFMFSSRKTTFLALVGLWKTVSVENAYDTGVVIQMCHQDFFIKLRHL